MKSIFFVLILCSLSVMARDIIVEATALPSADKNANTWTLESKENGRATDQHRLSDVLLENPSVYAIPSASSESSMPLVRGASSELTSYEWDGFPLEDPSHPAGGFEIKLLPIELIGKIRLVHASESMMHSGSSSTLLVHSEKRNRKSWLKLRAASVKDFGGIGSASTTGRFSSRVWALYQESGRGISQASQGSEQDIDTTTMLRQTMNYDLNSNSSVSSVVEWGKNHSSLDDVPNDSLGYFGQASRWGAGLKYENVGQTFDQEGMLLYQNFSRQIENPNSNWSGSWQGQRVHGRYLTNKRWTRFLLRSGLDGTWESTTNNNTYNQVESRERFERWNSLNSVVEGDLELFDNFTLRLGARLDQAFSEPSLGYLIRPQIQWAEKKVTNWFSLSTRKHRPTLYQLYSEYGNKNLVSEKLLHLEFGTDIEIVASKWRTSVVLFDSHYDAMIDFDFLAQHYGNALRTRVSGLEWQNKVNLTSAQELQLSYTGLLAKRLNSSSKLLRRPQHRVSAKWSVDFNKLKTSLAYQWVGKRYEVESLTSKELEMPGYSLVHVSANYPVLSNLIVTARIENLLNQKYEAVPGYSTRGLMLRGELQWTL